MQTANPDRYVRGFEDVDRTQVALVGGKGANLGELSRLDGTAVPPGFCLTTHAFDRVTADAPSLDDQLDRLSRLDPEQHDPIRTISVEIRRTIGAIVIPDEVASAIAGELARLGDGTACAVRSSATAEDLPTASFAGQQDTYLNVVGEAAVLASVSRCWASLFTERAVAYRVQNGVDHRKVRMAVVVQRMVFPQAAGVLFTADPVTSDRTVTSVEASFGLGEALVSGRVTPDISKVRDGAVVASTIAAKRLAVDASPGGGTQEVAIEPAQQEQPALTDAQVVQLAQLGRRIEAHFGSPQDVEWCLDDDGFHIVQSRPITTLFPVPEVDDEANHVYLSVGHQQMMTDAIKPLGLSMWQLTTPAPMREAGGRLFVDVTQHLAAPATRDGLLDVMGRSDPLMRDALQTVLDRGDFVPALADEAPGGAPASGADGRADGPDRERSRHRDRADRAQPGVDRGAAARHPDESRDRRCSTSSWRTSRSCGGSCSTRRAIRRSWPGWRPRGGSTTTCRSGSARRTPPTRSRSPSPTTSPPRWGWRCSTSPTRSARIPRS